MEVKTDLLSVLMFFKLEVLIAIHDMDKPDNIYSGRLYDLPYGKLVELSGIYYVGTVNFEYLANDTVIHINLRHWPEEEEKYEKN